MQDPKKEGLAPVWGLQVLPRLRLQLTFQTTLQVQDTFWLTLTSGQGLMPAAPGDRKRQLCPFGLSQCCPGTGQVLVLRLDLLPLPQRERERKPPHLSAL